MLYYETHSLVDGDGRGEVEELVGTGWTYLSRTACPSVGRSVCTGYERTITARDDGVFSL